MNSYHSSWTRTVTSGHYCMGTGFEWSHLEHALRQRYQDRVGMPKLILTVLLQWKKQAKLCGTLWSLCLLLRTEVLTAIAKPYLVPEPGMVSALYACHPSACSPAVLFLADADCVGDTTCCLHFRQRESAGWNYSFRVSIYLYCDTCLDLSQWMKAYCTRHSISREFYLKIISIFKSIYVIYKACLRLLQIITSFSLTFRMYEGRDLLPFYF